VALATSMFWLPAPERADPRVEKFLAFEREWLTGKWTVATHLFYRHKTRAWTRPWGGWKDVEAVRPYEDEPNSSLPGTPSA
jgi:hypothetical protein